MSNKRRARLHARMRRMERRGVFRVWRRRIGLVVSAVTLVAVAVALSRPAITMGTAPTCGLSEHVHGSACYDESGMLLCTVTEHQHTEACKTASNDTLSEDPAASDDATQIPEPVSIMGEETVQVVMPEATPSDGSEDNGADGTMGERSIATSDENKGESEEGVGTMGEEAPHDGEAKRSLVARADGYVVSVAYGSDAGIDENTSLEVRSIDTQSEEHITYLGQAMEALGDRVEDADDYEARFFDITLMNDGDKVEPQASVRVTISGDDVPAKSTGAEAQVVHFAEEGTEVIEARAVSTRGGTEQNTPAYTFEQASFSVSGLLVKAPDVPVDAPVSKQIAKQRNQDEIEEGATYLVYMVINNAPYAIGADGTLHQMARTTDGRNIYSISGTAIDTSLIWTFTGVNKSEYGFGVKATSADGTRSIFPEGTSRQVVIDEQSWANSYFRRGENNQEFYLNNWNSSAWANIDSLGTLYAASGNDGARAVYLAEVASTSSHTATGVQHTMLDRGQLYEGYYVISRLNPVTVNASSTQVTRLDYNLVLNKDDAIGVGSRQIQGFLNSEIWYIKPMGDDTYAITNVWSGERLSPVSGSQDGLIRISIVADDKYRYSYYLQSVETNQYLYSDRYISYAKWENKAAAFFFYRIDNDGSLNAYFDTSLGGNGFYKYSADGFSTRKRYMLDEVDENGYACHTIALPTAEEVGTTGTDDSTKPYHYRLNGWYEVYSDSKQWHAPGSLVRVYGNAVFYADWVAESYDIGQAENLSSKSVYMPSITTTLFDYNELMNVYSLGLLSSADEDISSSGHAENFYDSGTNSSFIFFYIDGNGKNLHNVRGNDSLHPRAKWNSSSSSTPGDGGDYTGHYNGDITAGIITPGAYPGNTELPDKLFNPNYWLPGKTYVGADHYLYSYDDDTGYYYYDSNRNAASYNQSDGRFYVYNYTNRTNKSQIDSDSWKDNTDFLPLNYGQETFTEASGDVNYWFGMKTEFDFYLPNDATTDGTKNKSIKNDDMAFRFSGDDDVWVLVDNQVVLDLGGVHGTVYGEINFSKCTVTTGQSGADAIYELKDGSTTKFASDATLEAIANDQIKVIGVNGDLGVSTSENDLLKNLKAGNHKITFLYLERGASESNASIYFNIAPTYQVNLTKVDGTNGTTTPLTGAKFKVYTDQACTQEATNVSARKGKPYDEINGYQDTDGAYYFDGFVANQDYYIKEIEAPVGYSLLSGPVKISINGETNTCTYIPTDEQGESKEGQVVCVATLEGQGTNFSGTYGGFAIEIPNYTGREIPAAGGSGTTPFVVTGSALAVASVIALVLRKRARGGVRA